LLKRLQRRRNVDVGINEMIDGDLGGREINAFVRLVDQRAKQVNVLAFPRNDRGRHAQMQQDNKQACARCSHRWCVRVQSGPKRSLTHADVWPASSAAIDFARRSEIAPPSADARRSTAHER
jgi:hypothetical protein